MATQQRKKTTKKSTNTKKKQNVKKTTKKDMSKNVNYYEIKLISLFGFTILSILSLHTEWIGLVGEFIRHIYFGLFSYAGYSIPYIVFLVCFYKINNRLLPYRTKSMIGFGIVFITIMFVVNLFNYDVLNAQFIEPKLSMFKASSLELAYVSGVKLEGSGLLGTIFGKFFISLVGRVGLGVIIATLWIIAFILITNINVIEFFQNKFKASREKYKENQAVKKQAKEEYKKASQEMVEKRKEAEEDAKEHHQAIIDHTQDEKLNKALNKVEKRLKQEEKSHQKAVEDYDAMFHQSPTRSIVDHLFKKTSVPTKEEILEAAKTEPDPSNTFDQFETSGYAFDENFEQDEIIESSPDIFDNSQPVEPVDIPITGFGALVDECVQKAYDDQAAEQAQSLPSYSEDEVFVIDDLDEVIEPSESQSKVHTVKHAAPVEETKVCSFDAAFKASEAQISHASEDIFESGTPMTEEEKNQVSMFDQITGKKEKVNYEESQVSDRDIINHMSERVRLEYENYRIPKISLLTPNTSLANEDKSQVYEKAKHLEEILQNFNVDAKVISIAKGPAITRYEIQLKPGTKMSKITNLSDDIALNLATQQVRIAAVPGKAAVGIEVPNDSTAIVRLREVLETDSFKDADAKLSVGLGKNIAGTPIIADLSKMPHMLIAGATGSGKSVCVNTLITSILLNAKPDEVKFLMIDPKVVELNNYNGIPHLILPVVTDPKKASVALNWAVQEMTRRYNAFAENGVRDIKGFNKKYGEDKSKFMPQIVVIIDELADLMMVAPNQVEDAICRLAQMARAAGIHLIVATQRPSVDVITGVIKANIPSRVAFAVSSAIDSRTIIDMSGAEKLLGKGDMLYYPVGSTKPQRVQGAFISDEEVEAIVSAVKNQFEAFSYDENLLSNVNTNISTGNSDDEDEYMVDAIKLVVELEQASISMLQRKFKIGYNRAARIVDEMEERGIVGPSQGSKPREVLISKSELESM